MNILKWLVTLPRDEIDLFELNKQVLKQEAERKLRDQFAAKAMEALLHNWKEEVIPQMAYKIADEMLAEREK